jgi:hypothetical protein
VTSDLENILEEMTDPEGHDMQWHEVFFAVFGWLMIHAPQAKEEYEDGTSPVLYYGHQDGMKKVI